MKNREAISRPSKQAGKGFFEDPSKTKQQLMLAERGHIHS
jgi:hypothetical protein